MTWGVRMLRDLRRMEPKKLTVLELTVLADEPNSIELELAAEAETRALEQHTRARSAAITAGMEQARRQGIHVGRAAGGESVDAFLAKATSQRVMEVLQAHPDLSIRRVARAAGVAVETVRKVATAIGHPFGSIAAQPRRTRQGTPHLQE